MAVRADVVRGRAIELVGRQWHFGAGWGDWGQGTGRAELGVQGRVLSREHRCARRVERASHGGEQAAGLELAPGCGECCRVLPDRLRETEDQAGRVCRRLREVAGEKAGTRRGVAARRRRGVAAEAGRLITEHREGEPAEEDEPSHERRHRVPDDAPRDRAPGAGLPGALDTPRQQLGPAEPGLEDRALDGEQGQSYRQQSRQEGEPGQQDHTDRDCERDPQVRVEREARQQQREDCRDHRARGKGDGLTHPGYRGYGRLPGRRPGAQQVTPERPEQPAGVRDERPAQSSRSRNSSDSSPSLASVDSKSPVEGGRRPV